MGIYFWNTPRAMKTFEKYFLSFLTASAFAGRAPQSDGLDELDLISERITSFIKFSVKPHHPDYPNYAQKQLRLDRLFARLKGRAQRIDGICWPEILFEEEDELSERSADACAVMPKLVKRVKSWTRRYNPHCHKAGQPLEGNNFNPYSKFHRFSHIEAVAAKIENIFKPFMRLRKCTLICFSA